MEIVKGHKSREKTVSVEELYIGDTDACVAEAARRIDDAVNA